MSAERLWQQMRSGTACERSGSDVWHVPRVQMDVFPLESCSNSDWLSPFSLPLMRHTACLRDRGDEWLVAVAWERERRDRREREERERGEEREERERESEREKAYIAFLRRARLWNSNRASVGWCLQTTGEKKIWILWWNLFECYRQKSNSLMEMSNVSPWKQWKWVSNRTRVSCRMWPDLPRDQSLNQKSEIWGWRSKYLFYFTLFYILFYRSIVVLLFSCIMDCIIEASFGYVNNSIN